MSKQIILIDLTKEPYEETLVDALDIFPVLPAFMRSEEVDIADFLVYTPEVERAREEILAESKQEEKEETEEKKQDDANEEDASVTLHTEEKSEEESMSSDDSLHDFIDDSETILRKNNWRRAFLDSPYDQDDESSVEPPLYRRKFTPAASAPVPAALPAAPQH